MVLVLAGTRTLHVGPNPALRPGQAGLVCDDHVKALRIAQVSTEAIRA
jgi:hypothetical protein